MNGLYTLSILVISLFILNFASGCLEEKDVKIVRMTFEEFINDYHTENSNTNGNTSRQFRGWYSTLNEGDTVVIKDTLQKMTYFDTYNTTSVEFSSTGGRTVQLQFAGDLWDKFQQGDNVTITLHIIHVSFIQNISPFENISVDIETYEEGWDSTNNHEVPVPPQCIKPA